MAQYIFIKTRNNSDMLENLDYVCKLLTPDEIKKTSDNFVGRWSKDFNSYYAIQNSKGVESENNGALLIGWVDEVNSIYKDTTDINGSYAIIKSLKNKLSFFCDQFGSRTLWYYIDNENFIISTSQRAIVALKNSFHLNKESIAWYLSAGCQGPFISWDKNIIQVLPDFQYYFDEETWSISSIKKKDLLLPKPNTTRKAEFINFFEKKLKKSLLDIICKNNEEKKLLPISGGLDSRLLLGLSDDLKIINNLDLINWGVKSNLFDDKKAATEISKFYDKELIDIYLPEKIEVFDPMLNNFVAQSEGRIDHFNAFTDCFNLWKYLNQCNYKIIIRGDIPYPTGFHLNDKQARQKIGLERLSDFMNFNHSELDSYKNLQTHCNLSRDSDESLIRWRDRLYASWRVPIILSGFTQLMSAYSENRTPMMDWELFKKYMGLPDRNKGNKLHIRELWGKYDKTKVSESAVPSLKHMTDYFNTKEGKEYLRNNLENLAHTDLFGSNFIKEVSIQLENHNIIANAKISLIAKLKFFLSKKLPPFIKYYLKSKQPMQLSYVTVAYRLILIDKIINLYMSDSKSFKKVKN
ncbi:hypothetical protein HG532_05205 [Moraxella osloensis]|nr:hypothetical protein [Moraxella osloensis]MBW4009421.1 hypothetical protein [Moraxella osloensis]